MNVRKLKKISQVNMATYLKISQTQYHKRETGKIKISDSEWERIARLLNINIEEIYEDDQPSDETDIMDEITFLKEKINVLEMKVASLTDVKITQTVSTADLSLL
ncbi:helix-turn-helix transcriptional regulator [uncultured Chryseobacterium sp.]|uniref:helix-turn-helix transcriptional regulator n=1 Tax=uncultured Chryseobacterium sp. TaxID=259322 RepID=UPI0025DC4B97|nr:helix-turn-helix transcriptional regulator [uncultured Chryseobacterium sp.]